MPTPPANSWSAAWAELAQTEPEPGAEPPPEWEWGPEWGEGE